MADQSRSHWIITWPVAVLACVVVICATVLAVLGVIPKEVVTYAVTFLVGAVIPSQPFLTRWRTVYSMRPPPQQVDSDRPDPAEPETKP